MMRHEKSDFLLKWDKLSVEDIQRVYSNILHINLSYVFQFNEIKNHRNIIITDKLIEMTIFSVMQIL